MPLSGEFLPPPLPKMGMIVGEKLAEYDPFDLLPVGSVVFTTLGSVPPPDGTFAARVVPPPDGTFAARVVPPPDGTFAARVVPPPDGTFAARVVPPPDGTFAARVVPPPDGTFAARVVPPPDGTFAARVVPPPDGTFAARVVPPPDGTFAARVVPPPDGTFAARVVPPPDGTFNVVTCALAGSGTGSPRYSGMALSELRLLSAAVRALVSPVTKSAYAGTALNDANGVSACTSPV